MIGFFYEEAIGREPKVLKLFLSHYNNENYEITELTGVHRISLPFIASMESSEVVLFSYTSQNAHLDFLVMEWKLGEVLKYMK